MVARELHVVRANVLADVAAIDVRPVRLMKLTGNLSLELDREVRNAAPGIQYTRLDERISWARVETARTASAAIGLEGRVGSQFEIQQQRSDEKEGPEPGVHKIGVLAEPSQSRAPREIALEYRPGIYVGFSRDGTTDFQLQPAMQLVQSLCHDVVVIIAA